MGYQTVEVEIPSGTRRGTVYNADLLIWGEEPIAHDPREEDPHHDERGHNGAPDEQIGDIHYEFPPPFAVAEFLISTFVPGTS